MGRPCFGFGTSLIKPMMVVNGEGMTGISSPRR
jgi:hypothetical protein